MNKTCAAHRLILVLWFKRSVPAHPVMDEQGRKGRKCSCCTSVSSELILKVPYYAHLQGHTYIHAFMFFLYINTGPTRVFTVRLKPVTF